MSTSSEFKMGDVVEYVGMWGELAGSIGVVVGARLDPPGSVLFINWIVCNDPSRMCRFDHPNADNHLNAHDCKRLTHIDLD